VIIINIQTKYNKVKDLYELHRCNTILIATAYYELATVTAYYVRLFSKRIRSNIERDISIF